MAKRQGKKLKKLDPFEAEVRAYLERFFAAKVEQHDDNSQDRMPDLRIEHDDRPWAGVEIVRHADRRRVDQAAELAKNGIFMEVQGLTHSWSIELAPATRLRSTRQHLPGVLIAAEHAGHSTIQGLKGNSYDQVSHELGRLRIPAARRGHPVKPGEIATVTILQINGGSWDGDMNVIPHWCETVLDEAEDVPTKLRDSVFKERHAVLVPTLHGDMVPFRALFRGAKEDRFADLPSLPTESPELPEGVDQVWVWGERILHWGPDSGWTEHHRPQPQVHQMHLKSEPFSLMKSGLKVTEVRVADEKRRAVLPGDDIVFTCEGDELTMTVERVDRYADFDEMYRFELESDINPNLDASTQITGLRALYSAERESLGVFAIRGVRSLSGRQSEHLDAAEGRNHVLIPPLRNYLVK